MDEVSEDDEGAASFDSEEDSDVRSSLLKFIDRSRKYCCDEHIILIEVFIPL